MKRRTIIVEIITSDQPNDDPIKGLLEAARWLQCNYGDGQSASALSSVQIEISGARLDSPRVIPCRRCGKYQPEDALVCFGCVQTELDG